MDHKRDSTLSLSPTVVKKGCLKERPKDQLNEEQLERRRASKMNMSIGTGK